MEVYNDSLILMTNEEYQQLSMEQYTQYHEVVKEQVGKAFLTGYYMGGFFAVVIIAFAAFSIWLIKHLVYKRREKEQEQSQSMDKPKKQNAQYVVTKERK